MRRRVDVTVEHVVIPQITSRRIRTRPAENSGGEDVAIPDPLLPLAFAAAVTKKIKLATGVLILPQRHPLYVARSWPRSTCCRMARHTRNRQRMVEEEFTSLASTSIRAAHAPTSNQISKSIVER